MLNSVSTFENWPPQALNAPAVRGTSTWLQPNSLADVTGDFSTSGRDRGSRAGGRWYAKQEVQAGTDRQSAEADRGGGGQRQEHAPGVPRCRDQRAELLPLAQGVRRT